MNDSGRAAAASAGTPSQGIGSRGDAGFGLQGDFVALARLGLSLEQAPGNPEAVDAAARAIALELTRLERPETSAAEFDGSWGDLPDEERAAMCTVALGCIRALVAALREDARRGDGG